MVIREEVINKLKSIVGDDWVVTSREMIERYLYDETPEALRPMPSVDVVVVKPRTTGEVSKIVKLANEEKIPIFPRGGGTGLVGGAIPTRPGIILSLERMDGIRIDKENLVAEVEAGVTLAKLLEEADRAGLFFPPHPGDEGATVGGMIATNAGGARAVRTGVMRNYVLGIEVVLPNGDVVVLGSKVIKNNTGYNLMHLIIGSEGTLGIITKAYIRLYPKYRASATMVTPFKDRLNAVKAAHEILKSGVIPLLLEYVEKDVIERSASYLGLKWPVEEGFAHLIVTVSESSEDLVYSELELINDVITKYTDLEPVVATRDDEQKEILKIRSEIYTSLKKDLIDILDMSLPIGKIYDFMEEVDKLERKYNTWIPVIGHIGDGNLHAHIMKTKGWTKELYERLEDELYEITMRLGGVISGEHGIGVTRMKYFMKYADRKYLELLRMFKKVLDPNNILNPGKVVPEE